MIIFFWRREYLQLVRHDVRGAGHAPLAIGGATWQLPAPVNGRDGIVSASNSTLLVAVLAGRPLVVARSHAAGGRPYSHTGTGLPNPRHSTSRDFSPVSTLDHLTLSLLFHRCPVRRPRIASRRRVGVVVCSGRGRGQEN